MKNHLSNLDSNKSNNEYQAYKQLLKEIAFHDDLYYSKAHPQISDFEYDCLKIELLYLVSKHPEWKKIEEKVGDDRIKGFVTAPHRESMLSLANTYNQSELFDFDKRAHKSLIECDIQYIIEPKIDGVAVSVTFEKGKLIRALTRGNGIEGDDITHNVFTIQSLPHLLNGKNIPELIEIRGEIFIDYAVFEKINADREEEGIEPYANPRNLAAGTVKLLDSQKAAERNLRIIFYDIGYCKPSAESLFQTQWNIHDAIAQWGLPHQEKIWQASNIQEAWQCIQELDQARKSFSYGTDGAVMKINKLSQKKALGFTSKIPLGAIAYKFTPERAETLLKDITIQVGRTGVLTPVAELNPVSLSGSMIARATLHNADEIIRLDIRVGDTVLIEKAGEVIPAIVGIIHEKRNVNSIPFVFPKKCPACGSEVVRLPEEVAWRCTNASCPPQVRRRISHFSSRNAMNIDNLGIAVVDQLVSCQLANNIADLYDLKIEKFLLLDKFAQKSAQNLFNAIQKSKTNELWRLIHGLGIPHIGVQNAKELANYFNNLSAIIQSTENDLIKINGIGEIVAKSVFSFFKNTENLLLIERLKNNGVNMTQNEDSKNDSGPLQGKKIVITGTFPNASRDELKKKIESHGGQVIEVISKKTDFLLVGENSGSKLKKAQELEIKILSLSEFYSTFNI